jgi:hypothetical protein
MSKKKDEIIGNLSDKIGDLEAEISRDLRLVNVKNLESEIARLKQEVHERELDRRKFLCILEDVDDFLTTNLIPKLFINKQASKHYAFDRTIQGYEELAADAFMMKTWVIDGKQPSPHHERKGYTKIDEYPERGSYKWRDKDGIQ